MKKNIKKIVYIVNARIPTEKAHGYQICKMCEEFANTGIKVKLLVPIRENPIKKSAFSFYGLERNFEIKYIKSFDFIEYKPKIGRICFYLQSLWFFIKLIFKKFDKQAVIYTRAPEIAWLFKLRKFKVCYECHDWFSEKRKKIFLFFLRKCNFIITTNNYIKQEFIKNNFNNKKVLVAPNGIDLKVFDLKISKTDAVKKLNIRKDIKEKLLNNKVLVYTGSFKTKRKEKGIKEILKALKILKQKNIYFLAIGGEDRDIRYYKKIARDLNVIKKTYFFARKDQKKLALFQKGADILLMPFPLKAHYEYFMTPIKMFEYMASKRPIIASDLPSIREILHENKPDLKTNAILVRPGNAKSLAKAIDFALKNPDFCAKISKQAYKDVQKYTWEKRAGKILELIIKK